jgi:hypothetical protein
MIHHQERHASETGARPQDKTSQVGPERVIDAVGADERAYEQQNRK